MGNHAKHLPSMVRICWFLDWFVDLEGLFRETIFFGGRRTIDDPVAFESSCVQEYVLEQDDKECLADWILGIHLFFFPCFRRWINHHRSQQIGGFWVVDPPRIAYFDNHYGKPLGTLDKQHCIALKDLPRATKIPFQSQETEAPASKLWAAHVSRYRTFRTSPTNPPNFRWKRWVNAWTELDGSRFVWPHFFECGGGENPGDWRTLKSHLQLGNQVGIAIWLFISQDSVFLEHGQHHKRNNTLGPLVSMVNINEGSRWPCRRTPGPMNAIFWSSQMRNW